MNQDETMTIAMEITVEELSGALMEQLQQFVCALAAQGMEISVGLIAGQEQERTHLAFACDDDLPKAD